MSEPSEVSKAISNRLKTLQIEAADTSAKIAEADRIRECLEQVVISLDWTISVPRARSKVSLFLKEMQTLFESKADDDHLHRSLQRVLKQLKRPLPTSSSYRPGRSRMKPTAPKGSEAEAVNSNDSAHHSAETEKEPYSP